MGQEPKHVHLVLVQVPFHGHRVDRLSGMVVIGTGMEMDSRAVQGMAQDVAGKMDCDL